VEGREAVLEERIWSGLGLLDRLILDLGGFRVFGVVLIPPPVVGC